MGNVDSSLESILYVHMWT